MQPWSPKNIAYSFAIFLFVFVSFCSLYFIGVNTIFANRVLPHVRVENIDVSLLSKQDLQQKLDEALVSQLPTNLNVQIDNYNYNVPVSELNITADISPLTYGKGADMLKVLSQGFSLIAGPDLQIQYVIDSQAIINHLPLNVAGDNPAYIDNNTVKNCSSNQYSLGINKAMLSDLARQALTDNATLEAKLADISSVPDTANILQYCTLYHQQAPLIETAVKPIGLDIDSFDLIIDNTHAAHWAIHDEATLRDNLRAQAVSLNIPADNGKYEDQKGKILLLEPYTVGQSLNIEDTVKAIDLWLEAPTTQLPLEFDTVQPAILSSGREILDFTKHLAAGKTRIDIIRDNHPNWVLPYAQYGLEEIDDLVIQPHVEFSYIDTINPQPGGWTQEGRPIGAGICNASTTIFRAALESGFPITDRSPHPTYIESYEWGYPMNLVDAAYLTSPRVDMKFINDLDYPILFKFNYNRPGDNWQYHTLDVYTSSKAPDRKVVIDNFRQWNVISSTQYDGAFDRHVYQNGTLLREDSFHSRYGAGE